MVWELIGLSYSQDVFGADFGLGSMTRLPEDIA